MRLWVLVPLGLAFILVADLTSARFDPVFDAVPSAVSITLLVMASLSVLMAIFFATYAIPAEIDSRVVLTVATKPLGRGEFIVGKMVGLWLVLAAVLALLGSGAYIYLHVRAGQVRAMARERLVRLVDRQRDTADLGALEMVATRGPLRTYDFFPAAEGPAFRVRFGTLPTERERDVRWWALAYAGMRLSWDLSATPFREWATKGPVALRLHLRMRRPESAPSVDALKLVAELVPARYRALRRETPEDAPEGARVYRTEVSLNQAGVLAVPVVSGEAPPPVGGLHLPPDERLRLNISIASGDPTLGGYAVGAAESALEIVATGGRSYTVETPPDLVPEGFSGKRWLIGREVLPRQVATYTFNDVPPNVLSGDDAVVEVDATLDAWSAATLETTVRLTFRNTETGAEEAVRFTPESRHPSLVQVDASVFRGGPVEAHLEVETSDDFMGLQADSLRLRSQAGPYVAHLGVGVFHVWLFGSVLAAVAVVWSARLSWFVAMLGTVLFSIIGMGHEFILGLAPMQEATRGVAGWLARHLGSHVDLGWNAVARYVVLPVPNLRALLPPDSMPMGEAVPPAVVGETVLWAALLTALAAILGWLLYRKREVAA